MSTAARPRLNRDRVLAAAVSLADREGAEALTVRRLADDLGLEVRSMGMTADLEVAIQEASTMVRVGTGLFGPRRVPNLPPD